MLRIREGSISTATLKLDDLIPAFVEALDDIREQFATPRATTEDSHDTEFRKRQVAIIDDLLGTIEERQAVEGYYASEEADLDLDNLTDTLNAYAPEGMYFGSHPGDGADFGFWRNDEEDAD